MNSIKLGKVLEYLIAQKMKQSYLFKDYKEKDTPIAIKLYFNTQENKEGLRHLSERDNVIEYLYDRKLLLPYLIISTDRDFIIQNNNEYDIQQDIINKLEELTNLYKDLSNESNDSRLAKPKELLVNRIEERIEIFLKENYEDNYEVSMYLNNYDEPYIEITFK